MNKKIFCSFCYFIIFVNFFIGCTYDKAIYMVKNSYFDEYPSKTVGEAVDGFFGDPQWSSGVPVDSELNGFTIVNCNGYITYNDEPAEAVIQFLLDETDGSFVFNAFEINGVPQNQYRKIELLNLMYE